MKNRIIATRSGNQVTTIINGQSFPISLDTREEAVELYKDILKFKASGTDEDVTKLKEILSPGFKLSAGLEGKLTKDRVGNYYLGTSIPLPRKLMQVILESIEDELPISNLEKFWKLLCLNPDIHVRESLFKFMDRFKMPVTDNGYFIAYKSVAWKGEKDKSLGVFVSQQYVAKKSSGRPTDDLLVVQLGENSFRINTEEEYTELRSKIVENQLQGFRDDKATEWMQENKLVEWTAVKNNISDTEELLEIATKLGYVEPTEAEMMTALDATIEIEVLGKLDDMFRKITSMFDFDTPTFTDWHTKKSTIVLGQPVSMPREECDNNPNNTCSSGLHVGAPGYVSSFGGYGDSTYILACLVNPMNVVAIPHDYGYEKMRCSEYLPYAICEFNNGNIQELDTNYFEDDYINYEKDMLNQLSADIDDSTEEGKEQKSLISQRLIELG